MNKTLMIATALMISALSPVAAQPPSSVLQSLPAEVQTQIEHVRAACREYLVPRIKSQASPGCLRPPTRCTASLPRTRA